MSFAFRARLREETRARNGVWHARTRLELREAHIQHKHIRLPFKVKPSRVLVGERTFNHIIVPYYSPSCLTIFQVQTTLCKAFCLLHDLESAGNVWLSWVNCAAVCRFELIWLRHVKNNAVLVPLISLPCLSFKRP